MRPLSCFLGAMALLAVFSAFAAGAPAPAKLSAEEIVQKNVAARGGLAAWRAVDNITMSGQLEAGGKKNSELPFVLRMKREHKSRLEVTFAGKTAVQVFDGAHGWKVRPFLNRNDVEPFSPAEAKAAEAWAELDGPLVDYAKKGTRIELAGTEAVEGKSNYKLKLTFKDRSVRYIWIDAASFLETKIDGQPRKMDGKMRKVAVYYRDFRPEAGLMMPHGLETIVDGVKQSHKMAIQEVRVNQPMQADLFQKPRIAVASTQTR